MKYNELKEMTIKEWDGEPFEAYSTDFPSNAISGRIIKVIGYRKGWWLSDLNWRFVYPVEWNKDKVEEALNPKPKRMTNRQLAMWLAKGNGEKKCENARAVDSNHIYMNDEAGEPCPDYIKVRKWYTKEWVEPTVDLLEE